MTTAPRSPSSFGSFWAMAAAPKRRTLNVPIRLIRRTVSKCWSWCGPLRLTVRSAQPTPAQLTVNRTSSSCSTAPVPAASTSASFVTSAVSATAASPGSPASAFARSSFTSAIATRAPRATSARAVASPRPEAPPATKAPVPLRFIAAADYLRRPSRADCRKVAITDKQKSEGAKVVAIATKKVPSFVDASSGCGLSRGGPHGGRLPRLALQQGQAERREDHDGDEPGRDQRRLIRGGDHADRAPDGGRGDDERQRGRLHDRGGQHLARRKH